MAVRFAVNVSVEVLFVRLTVNKYGFNEEGFSIFVKVKVNAWLELIDGTWAWMTCGKNPIESCEPNRNICVEVE